MSAAIKDPPSTARAISTIREPRDLPKPNKLTAEMRAGMFRRRLKQLQQQAGEFEGEAQDITRMIRPRRGKYLGTRQGEVSRRSTKIINSAATFASRTLGGGMMSGVSSPARPWFVFKLPDPNVSKIASVKQWLFSATAITLMILARSNFYDQIQQMYRDVGDFGNSPMIIDEDYDDVIRCTVLAPGEYWMSTDYKGRVRTLYWRYWRTVLQLVQEYGIENVSQSVADRYNKGQMDDMVPCIVAIEPNFNQLPDVGGPASWPWVAVYFEENADRIGNGPDEKVLRRSGYREWPVAVARWELQSGETWAWGPGLEALPDAQALQVLEREKGKAIQKLVTPPTQSPVAPQSALSHLPGANTVLPTTGATGAILRPLYEQNAQGVNAIGSEIEKHERRISRAYYEDLFLMLAQSTRREITAREVEERHEEKLLALGPVLERLHNEALNIAIERTFWIAYRAGVIPPAPEEIQGMPLRVQYTSILAQAQRAVSANGIDRFMGFVGQLVAAFPSASEKINSDAVVDEYADTLNVPPGLLHGEEEVAKIRQESAAQQQQATQMAAATQGADAAKTLSEARLGQNNILDLITGYGGQQ